MRKSIILLLMISMMIINVKADMGPPSVITYKGMITNRDGAYCYEDGKKTDVIIPYKTVFEVFDDVNNGFIYVENKDYHCNVRSSDLSALSYDFDINSKDVEGITPIKAMILANGGLNLRSGPAVSYPKIITIPQYTVVTLKLHAGTYWYYTEYNGKNGWITTMNYYVGFEDNRVLVNYNDTNIYNSKGNIIGKIPKNTEITSYLRLEARGEDEPNYYVIYNGTEGYLYKMYEKTENEGKIKLLKDKEITDSNGKPLKRLLANQDLVYDMKLGDNGFYLKEKNAFVYLDKEEYEDIVETKLKVKENGYLGEGIFGETKEERQEEPQQEVKEETKEKENFFDRLTEIQKMILGFVAGIVVALTIIVIVLLVLKNKNSKALDNYVVNDKKTADTMEENDETK